MPCECKRCGQPVEDCLTLCIKCFLETSDDKVKKNIVAGGRFYERRTMREKITRTMACILGWDWESLGEHRKKACINYGDLILRAVSEEIEKVENPYDSYYRMGRYDGFEDCRVGILLLLRPKGNPVGNAEL